MQRESLTDEELFYGDSIFRYNIKIAMTVKRTTETLIMMVSECGDLLISIIKQQSQLSNTSAIIMRLRFGQIENGQELLQLFPFNDNRGSGRIRSLRNRNFCCSCPQVI